MKYTTSLIHTAELRNRCGEDLLANLLFLFSGLVCDALMFLYTLFPVKIYDKLHVVKPDDKAFVQFVLLTCISQWFITQLSTIIYLFFPILQKFSQKFFILVVRKLLKMNCHTTITWVYFITGRTNRQGRKLSFIWLQRY